MKENKSKVSSKSTKSSKKSKANNSSNDYTIICIDGGGTKTHGVLFIGDEKKAEYKAGTTRIGSVGVGESCERTLNVILELCKSVNISTSDVDVFVVGLAGVWLESEKRRSLNLIKTLARNDGYVINDLLVTSDVEIAFEGAFGAGEGIVTIVGTGSIGLARFGKNKFARCGGWGIELDDEGSGAWVGREGLTAVMRAIDGRSPYTILVEKLQEIIPTFDISEPRTIVKAFNERVFEYQSITPLVMECAEEGDLVCQNIIERAAHHLAELPLALLKNFSSKKPVKLALMGGIIDNDTLLSKMLYEELAKHPELECIPCKGNAIDGAKQMGLSIISELNKD
ncbi:MAG: hypothetical protein GX372_07445 [Ignavibacteria bacterium]|mgnify:CR=1 FL=1|jgi:N-acetylglucosamine kinase-like BadF-type ATPase|nr:hypothetical protein [Ignavibacteria bacterium]